MMKTNPKHWLYVLPNNGWARAVLTEDGTFMCTSDYGNHAYWWTAFGDGDFREWFIDTARKDPHYVLGKFCYGKQDEYDGQATYKSVLEAAKERFDDEPEKFEELKTELNEDYDKLYDEDDFRRWVENGQVTFEECWLLSVRQRPNEVRMFVERVLPRLCDLIEAQLKQEAASGATP